MPPRSNPAQGRQEWDCGHADLPGDLPADLFRRYDPRQPNTPYSDLDQQKQALVAALKARVRQRQPQR